MIKQKDIHNLFVSFSTETKIKIIESCGYDIEKIKKMEKTWADLINIFYDIAKPAVEYISKEI